MLIDPPANTEPIIPQDPISASSTVAIPTSPLSSPTPNMVSFSTQTRDEIQAINAKHSAIKNKLDMLANSINDFIRSITSSSSFTNSASAADNNFNYDSFVRNPPNPIDIDNLSLHDSLFCSNSLTLPLLIPLIFPLLTLMVSKSKRLSNYTVFSSILDTSQYVRSSGGVFLFIENSLASHIHTYTSLSSRLLSVDLYFKGNVKLRIFVVYISPTSDQALRDDTIDLLIQALSEAKKLDFHHAVCDDFNMHLDQFYPTFFNQPQIASKHIHHLFNFLLSNRYMDFTPVNFSDSLGTFHRADIIFHIDCVWSCPLLKRFLLTSIIFDVRNLSFSDHNPVITYYDHSFFTFFYQVSLCSSAQLAFSLYIFF
ncbi:hypothetical protein RclHR1_04200024 [Rhizophagus clarus]|uniref:Endonuclease/exonuclease/phosphatase domain-containing protein n=1 Tax=Rhizophagus clarus TaxID=94130 RepID=A0A2Z6RFP8_9GLOM|nr:hypothetical protein RclHR1_04200024 [Rhizophagus clarus]